MSRPVASDEKECLTVIRKASIVCGILLAAVSSGAQPADPVPISLEEATRRALEKNFDLAIEREALVQAEEGVRGARGAYDPFLGLDLLYVQYTDPVNSSFSGAPGADLAPEQKGFSLGANVQQLLPSGASLTLSSSLARQETDSVFTPLSPAYLTSLGFDLRQPLLRDFRSDPARRAIRVASARLEGERSRLASTVANTVAAVEVRYWTLLANRRGVEVLESSVALAGRQLDETKVRVDAGVLARTDVAQPTAELQRRRGDLAQARDAVLRAENALKAAILADPEDPLWNRVLVPSDSAEDRQAPTVAAEEAVRTGLSRRPELGEAESGVAVAEIGVEGAESDLLPRLDLVASFAGRGLAGKLNPGFSPPFGEYVLASDLDGGVGKSYERLFGLDFPDAAIGLSFSLPVGNRTAKAAVATARSQQRQAELSVSRLRQQIVAEVQNAVMALEAARQRVAAAKAGREAAEVQLFAEQERFGVGLSTNFFVLTRQNELTNARVIEIRAIVDFVQAEAELARATGTILEQRRIMVDTPVALEAETPPADRP